MADRDLNGRQIESSAERTAHMVGGCLGGGAAIAFEPPEQVVIGSFRLRGMPRAVDVVDVEATAETESDTAIVWLTRTSPEPILTLGYVLRANAPDAHCQSYVPDLPEEAVTVLCERATTLWGEANRLGKVRMKGMATGLVRLGLTLVDELRVDLVWGSAGSVVVLAFRDLEPERIGTVTDLDGAVPRLYPTPTHMAWATESGRSERLIAAASDAYHRRTGLHG